MTTSLRQSTSPDAASNPLDWLGLLDRHGDYLYRYALLRLRDSAIAEDAVQETLLAALKGPEKPQYVSSPNSVLSERTWLAEIMRQKLIEHYLKTYRAHDPTDSGEVRHEDDPFEKDGEWAGHWREDMAPTNWELDVSSIPVRKKLWMTLSRCLSELSPKTAMAFTLREIDGLSSGEICDLLDISANDLWVTLHRARLKLSHLFETQFHLAGPLDPRKAGRSFQKPIRQNARSVSRYGIRYVSTLTRQGAVRILR